MALPVLDRMEIDDAGWTPQARAAAIHRQLGELSPPIPIHEIARALDIEDLREKPLVNTEGCLVTDLERSGGMILVNSASAHVRRRFTIAHELGHFICTWHRSVIADRQAAAARRYVELHPKKLAVVFSRDDRCLYAHLGHGFPWLPFNQGDPLPHLPTIDSENLLEMMEADPLDWLRPGATHELAVQVLRQQGGHAMILIEASEQDDGSEQI